MEVLAIMLALGLGAIGIAKQRSAEQRALNEWKWAAIKLGYSTFPGPRAGRTIVGSRWAHEMFHRHANGYEVYVGVRTVSGNDNTTYYTYVELFFPEPLRAVLGVVNQSPGIIEAFSGIKDIQLFDKRADDALRIYGRDSDEIRALLTPRVRASLVTLMKVYSVDLNSISVTLEIPKLRVTDIERLRAMIVLVQQLATEILEAQAQMPQSAHATILSHCWPEIAAKYQCSYIVANHEMHRQTLNWRVGVLDRLARSQWFTTLSVQMRIPLPRFKIEVAGSLAKLKRIFGAQDIELGDTDFDEYFIVGGRDQSQLKEILGQEARQSLLELAVGAGSAIEYFDCSQAGLIIVLNCSLYDKDHLDWTMERLVRFARTLAKHQEMPAAGPFR